MCYKNYAHYLRLIFGNKNVHFDADSININPELAKTVEQQLQDLWDPFSLEHIAVDRFLLQ